MIKKNVVVGSKMDEKPIPLLVQTAGGFNSSLYLKMDTKEINLKSIMGVISIGVLTGNEVEISADGDDEIEACNAIIEFLS